MKYLNLEEELLTFEIAKLAREKGFFNGSYNTFIEYLKNTPKQGYTNEDVSSDKIIPKGTIIEHSYNTEEDGAYSNKTIYKEIIEYENPTQSILQKWLRDYHNIHININYYGDHEDGHSCFRGEVVQYTIGQSVTRKSILSNTKEDAYIFRSYEKALEKSLYEALKLIENDNN
jgi:hypothetical protein